MKIKGYYFITDSALSRAGNESDIKNALKAGVKIFQYRDKGSDTRRIYKEALKLKKICKGATFLVNDRVDIALAVGADGVHLGEGDISYGLARKLLGRDKIIGVTIHSLKEAKAAEKASADYIGISPIFKTATKKDAGAPAGIGMIKKIKKGVSAPVVAIGGITLSNAKGVVRVGADAICAISAVITKRHVRKEIERFQKIFHKKD